jgi:hypothetical protein
MADPGKHRLDRRLVVAVVICGGLACNLPPPATGPFVGIGLLLSDAAGTESSRRSSERATRMVIEAANQAGGLEGVPFDLVVRRTPSDPGQAVAPIQALLDTGVALLIGPDHLETVLRLRHLHSQTLILPSFATDDIEFKPSSWFQLGPPPWRFSCELVSQYEADGHHAPLQIVSPGSFYSTELSYDLANRYDPPPRFLLGSNEPTPDEVQSLTEALAAADAYLLIAPPASAAALIRALAAAGALPSPERWYLSPLLHTPAFLESIPRGAMVGARGVSPGTVAGAGDFRARFLARWREAPAHDAHALYDAGAIAVLAMQRAFRDAGVIPTGNGLDRHVNAVTQPGGRPITWDEIGRGMELLRQGQEVEYLGLSGPLQFTDYGAAQASITKWWTIGEAGFTDTPHSSTCRSARHYGQRDQGAGTRSGADPPGPLGRPGHLRPHPDQRHRQLPAAAALPRRHRIRAGQRTAGAR